MASKTTAADAPVFTIDHEEQDSVNFGPVLRKVLMPLASLKLTVALFALSIVLIFAGTLAQVDMEIWEVMDKYFRTAVVWIPFQVFFPPSFFPSRPQIPGGIYFPGGWTIGGLMAANLLAAHALRFKSQASGTRLAGGLAAILVGCVITWLVVASGMNSDGVQDAAWIAWSTLWWLMVAGLAVVWLIGVVSIFSLEPQQKIERGLLVVTSVLLGGLLVWIVFQGEDARLGDSSMRILWQLVKGTFASAVLLAGCFLVFKKRAGIVLLHAGIGLLMFYELYVSVSATEAQMHLQEGQTVNFVKDIRELELAVIDPSHPDHDQVVVVPESILLAGRDEPIQHNDLPFNVQLIEFQKNSNLRRVKPGDQNPATAGSGLQWVAEEIRATSGTDSGGEVDLSAAYVKVTGKDGKDYGTYLLSLLMAAQDVPEKITVGDKTYDVYLRFKRIYKPYTMHLVDVRKDDYIGTDTPRNYSSDLRLVDPSRNVDREVHIWMNNPLRFSGETFYQSGYHRDSRTGVESTTLQVVDNSGWMIPYVACMIVAMGMLAQFSITLLRFLKRRKSATVPQEAIAPSAHRESQRKGRKIREAEGVSSGGFGLAAWVSAALVLVATVWIAGKARIPSAEPGEMKLYEFGKLPLLYEGRAKPIDTLARNSLLMISNRDYFEDGNGNRQPAIRWFLDVIANPRQAAKHRVFRIENFEVQGTLGLEPRKGYRYAFDEFAGKIGELSKQAELARKTSADQLSPYQKKVLELERRVGVLDLLVRAYEQPRVRPEHARDDLFDAIRRQQALAQRHPPLSIPPQEEDGEWETYSVAWTKDLIQTSLAGKEPHPGTEAMTSMLVAYAQDDAATFNREIEKFRQAVAAAPAAKVDFGKTDFEAFFNHLQPFYRASNLYLFAFILAALAWLGWSRVLNSASFWLITATLVLHTFAIIGRIYISGRPPVTNLYSSAVFIGWGCVVLGLIFEMVYRLGIGNIVGGVAGFGTLLIASYLAADGSDTFTVLQAVLDTQFWLATHVICITLGYAATFVAGLLGILYIIRGVATPGLTSKFGKDLSRMIYGTLCFAIFFSFVGTVLGGLWADDSWGRFWGWDPKENGALIIVLWNALVLHARWGAMVKDRGMAVLSVGGNIVTSWSWFGVNELGVGLHSYGFTEGVLMALGLFVASQLAVIIAGCLPKDFWWSSRHLSESA